MKRFSSSVLRASLLFFAAACAPLSPDVDSDALTDEAVQNPIEDWSPEACAVVQVANSATESQLDHDASLDRRAARAIVNYRTGNTPDPADDRPIASLEELDAISYVGPSAMRKLLRYAEQTGVACSFPPLELVLVNVSDWHGQLDPVAVPMVGNVGGAPALATYFARERAANPNTLVLTAGDGFGATPPLASFFEERPAVEAMNLMGFDADGIGNHNFDRGTEHFAQMSELAQFPYLSANLTNVDENMSCPAKGACIEPYRIFELGGVKVAVIGVTNPDAANLLRPGSLGTMTVEHPAAAAAWAQAEAAAEGAEVFVVLAHMGAIGMSNGQPVGPLVDFANAVTGFDAILGDHTNIQVNVEINGAVVLENRSTGVTYTKTRIAFDRYTRSVVSKTVEFVNPLSDVVPADQNVVNLLAPYRTQLSAAFDATIATTTGIFVRGSNVERLGEVALGNLVADSMRIRYGTQLGFTNGGGLRAPIPSSYAPANLSLRRPAAGYQPGPPYDVVVGDVFAVLPFGNSVVTRSISGVQLWAMLNHSVEALPNANGWFGQISGFRFVFDVAQPVGSRVTSVTLDNGTPILADQTRYTLATSDFIAVGGDGYSMLADGDGTSREKMADVLLDHVRALGTLNPTTDGRITNQPRP